MMKTESLLIISTFLLTTFNVPAQIRITEWMYGGANGEFIELTNVDDSPIDMTGWSYDDNSRTLGVFNLSGFGLVAAGQSVILTEADAADFRLAWELDAAVKILGGYTNSLGRDDEINIFDALGQLVDRLTYNDEVAGGGPRTNNVSGNIPFAALGANNPAAAILSINGDIYGSWAGGTDVGNPGAYPIPEPATIAVFGLGMISMLRRRT